MSRPYRSDVRRPITIAVAEAEHLADNDCSLAQACAQLGIKPDTLHAYCLRRGRPDIYWRLANREPNAEQRRAVRDGIQRSKREVA